MPDRAVAIGQVEEPLMSGEVPQIPLPLFGPSLMQIPVVLAAMGDDRIANDGRRTTLATVWIDWYRGDHDH